MRNFKLQKDQKGVALLLVSLFASILLVIVLGLATLVISEIRQAAAVEDAIQAFYSAESGIEFGLRYTLKGGIAHKNRSDAFNSCNDIASLTTRSFSDGQQVTWSALQGFTVKRDVDPGPGTNFQYFMRLSAIGNYRGVTRNVIVDFTPDCNWDFVEDGDVWGDGTAARTDV